MPCSAVLFLAISTAFFGASTSDMPPSLAKKAEVFEADLVRHYVFDGQLAPKMKLATPERPFVAYNMPDNAYMTGIYTGIMSMKFAATKDPEARKRALDGVRALNLLSTVSGKKGLLARAAVPVDMRFDDDGDWQPSSDGNLKWRTDVSSDQMDGVLYGYVLAYDLVARDAEKNDIARHVTDLVGHILDNGMKIVDYNGKPTQWGNYTDEYIRTVEPMNGLLLLQHLKIAAHITGNEKFKAAYSRFARDEGYAKLSVNARKFDRSGELNHSDDILLWLAYLPLLRLETDPELKGLYEASLRRSWNGEGQIPGIKVEQNSVFAFTVKHFLNDDSGLQAGIQSLEWFPMDMKWNKITIAKFEREFGFKFDPKPSSPEPKKGEVVPLDRRPKQWSVWVHTPFQTGSRTEDTLGEFNGHDYLMAYWLGRYFNLIAENK
jgi:hypothetical protein